MKKLKLDFDGGVDTWFALPWWRRDGTFHEFKTVLFTEEVTVYQVEPVSGDQFAGAFDAGKTVQMVYVGLCSHHELVRRYGQSARTACSAVSKQPAIKRNEPINTNIWLRTKK